MRCWPPIGTSASAPTPSWPPIGTSASAPTPSWPPIGTSASAPTPSWSSSSACSRGRPTASPRCRSTRRSRRPPLLPAGLTGGRPGNFFANTYDLKTRPRWEIEALSLHEAVPGHHLQIAIAQELEDLLWFRRFGGYTAYIEGWGLYSESLGGEMGFYQDPYSKFGQLTYEIWRAIRLVVDTGMHQFGWSRDEAIGFFRANTGKSEHDIVVEVDRYIVWPGQALAYKIGELKLKELKSRARQELGDKFDIRAFHDAVLGNGALPLQVLERHIDEWIAGQKMPDVASPTAPGT